MSFGELLFLTILALLVFGPRKLPEMARALARITAELRRASNEFRYTLEDEIRSMDLDLKGAGPKQIETKAVADTVAAADPEEPAETGGDGGHLKAQGDGEWHDFEAYGDDYGEEDWVEDDQPLEESAAGEPTATPADSAGAAADAADTATRPHEPGPHEATHS